MNVNKVQWYSSDGEIKLSMPFQKVDREARTVSGFATLDNVDRHDDIVTPEAALAAFQTFRGNVREMHQPKAVGKVLSFAPEIVYDPQTEKYYNGVYVEARVSKGAADTWEKVLDETLSGFSIGGEITESELVWDEELGKNIHMIKAMELYELSLVDNPANPLANIVSIQKVDSGGTQVAPFSEHVYTCKTCKTVVATPVDQKSCPQCETTMTDIGWIQRAEAVQKEITKMVSSFYKASDNQSGNNPLPETDKKTSEGAINMAEEHVEEPVAEESEVVEPEAVTEEVVEDETNVESDVAEEVDASETGEADAGAESKEDSRFDEIVNTLSDLKVALERIAEAAAEEKAEVATATAEVTKTLEAKISAVEAKLVETVERLEKSFDTVEKQIDAVASATATKKSGDLGGESAEVKKSLWNGHFLGINSLEN